MVGTTPFKEQAFSSRNGDFIIGLVDSPCHYLYLANLYLQREREREGRREGGREGGREGEERERIHMHGSDGRTEGGRECGNEGAR